MPTWVVRLVACAGVTVAAAALAPGPSGQARQPPSAKVVVVLVVDGLRPDAITPAVTPTLAALRGRGVTWRNARAALPTVTRVNSATLGTGVLPDRHGVVSNVLFVPAVDSAATLNTADPRRLLALGAAAGHPGASPVPVRSLADRLERGGVRFVAVSAGSGGNALLNAPSAPAGVGVLINHNLGLGSGAPGDTAWRVAYPDAVSRVVRARFGMPPADSAGPTLSGLQDWSDRVVRDYVLPELIAPAARGPNARGAALLLWTAEPDESQHRFGAGSPEATAALGALDRNVGRLLRALDSLGLRDQADVIVTSDHGFAWTRDGVDLVDSLVAAGFKRSATSTDVVVASDGQSVQLHVRGRDPGRTRALAAWLLDRPWVDVVFAPRAAPAGGRLRCGARADDTLPNASGRRAVAGWVPGTLALEALSLCYPAHGPDLFVSFPWTDGRNAFGVAGTHAVATRGAQGVIPGQRGGHGGLAPWVVRNTLFAAGPSFRRGVAPDAPAGTADVPRTLLALLGVADTAGLDGRVLDEGLRDGVGRDAARGGRVPSINAWTDTVVAPDGTLRVLQRSAVRGRTYVSAARRVEPRRDPRRR